MNTIGIQIGAWLHAHTTQVQKTFHTRHRERGSLSTEQAIVTAALVILAGLVIGWITTAVNARQGDITP